MKDPKAGVYFLQGEEGRTLRIPTYEVTDGGMIDGLGMTLPFCKGDKSNPEVERQEGVFTESLIEAAIQYLEAVNVGELANPYAANAILKLQEAQMWIDRRAQDRQKRNVQGTYQK